MVALDSSGQRIHDMNGLVLKEDGRRDSFVLWRIPLIPLDSALLHFLAEQLTNTGKRQFSDQAALRDADRVNELHESDYMGSGGDRVHNSDSRLDSILLFAGEYFVCRQACDGLSS